MLSRTFMSIKATSLEMIVFLVYFDDWIYQLVSISVYYLAVELHVLDLFLFFSN